jgi:hypothetical protein
MAIEQEQELGRKVIARERVESPSGGSYWRKIVARPRRSLCEKHGSDRIKRETWLKK